MVVTTSRNAALLASKARTRDPQPRQSAATTPEATELALGGRASTERGRSREPAPSNGRRSLREAIGVAWERAAAGAGKRLRSAEAALRRAIESLPAPGKRRGVLFIGYAEGDLGLGQSFRNNVVAAKQAGVPLAIYPFRAGIETRLIEPFMPALYATRRAYGLNFMEVAPDQVPVVFRRVGPKLTRGGYNILRTFWELPQAPADWRRMLCGVDEIWAPNDFVADALKAVFPGAISIIPPCVDTGEGPFDGRDAFAMDPDRFYFLFSFDYFSSPYRKNPVAVARAFRRAFASGDENVGLVIKSIGAIDLHPDTAQALFEFAAQDSRIIVIHRTLERQPMLSLIHACDAYVSLHRSEGFGAGMAEAMSMGKIVIGTDFSGSRDFLCDATGFPVPFALRDVEAHEYPWSEKQAWAEPDEDAAAAIMRQVADHPAIAAERARAGQYLVREKYGSRAVGESIRRRLTEIAAQTGQGGAL